MRIANLNDRATVLLPGARCYDIATESRGAYGPDITTVYENWSAFLAWSSAHEPSSTVPYSEDALKPVSPAPRQVFAIGLNYSDHAAETGLAVNREFPPVFAKWQSSLARPHGTVAVPEDSHVDWEVELVVVMGKQARDVSRTQAMDYVAGFTVGQDYSDRKVQFVGQAPQFGLAKSFAGFSPVGPALVTADEAGDLTSNRITCEVDGVLKQDGTLGQMIFPVTEIIEILSRIVTLYPGDLIFTGTPSGVGFGRSPREFLKPGQRVVSTIEGIGRISQNVVLRPAREGQAE